MRGLGLPCASSDGGVAHGAWGAMLLTTHLRQVREARGSAAHEWRPCLALLPCLPA